MPFVVYTTPLPCPVSALCRPICYTLLNVLFGALLVCTSWKGVSDKIRSTNKEAHKSSLVEALLTVEA